MFRDWLQVTGDAAFREGKRLYYAKRYRDALDCFVAAGEHPGALEKLGWMYYAGEGVQQSYGVALNYFLRAERLGDAQAAVNAGDIYEYGRGVRKSLDEALRHYRIAAERNHEDGMMKVAYFTNHGWGTRANDHEALVWARRCVARAKETGNAETRRQCESYVAYLIRSTRSSERRCRTVTVEVCGPDGKGGIRCGYPERKVCE